MTPTTLAATLAELHWSTACLMSQKIFLWSIAGEYPCILICKCQR